MFILMGRGDFDRPDFGRLKPPLPETNAPKTSSITFAKLSILIDSLFNSLMPHQKSKPDFKVINVKISI